MSRILQTSVTIKIGSSLDLARELQKNVDHEGYGDTKCNWCTWNRPRGFEKRLEEMEIRGRIETIQTITLSKLAGILRRVLETRQTIN